MSCIDFSFLPSDCQNFEPVLRQFKILNSKHFIFRIFCENIEVLDSIPPDYYQLAGKSPANKKLHHNLKMCS